jgi:carbon storage regulator
VLTEKEQAMLVLSRQRDESIMIGDNIVVTIVDIRGDKVRLGINAPSEIPVHRQEVYEAIQRENLRAAQLDPKDTQALGRGAGIRGRAANPGAPRAGRQE